ncbi:MAG: DNA polymerase III subunit delta, partial [Melioribacteraceae bacterium]|nr:DNA polymerase III subunit delta [Melioribacteraceae bacterium]
MAVKSKFESIYNLPKFLKDDSLLPIYFLFGEDTFTINNAIKAIEKKIAPLVASDFDREAITLSKDSSVSQLVDLAYSFPFGGGKKLIVAKGFEELREPKTFSNYVKDPADFTVLVIMQASKKAPLNQEPYKSLFSNKYIFEARDLEGAELSNWMFNKAKKEKINLSSKAGELLIEMVGDNKGLLEMQFEKIATYTKSDEEITPEIIKQITQVTKEYSIFDLQNALGRGDKEKAIKYAFNLLGSQTDMVMIIAMLTRYVTNLTKILNVNNDADGIIEVGKSYYFLKKTTYLRNEKRLIIAAKALLET